MNMTPVSNCGATSCSFNQDSQCHAIAITIAIAEASKAECNTYADLSLKGGSREIIAGVGACKVTSCRNNKNLECSAPAIQIDRKDGKVLCLTYQAK